MTCDWIRLNNRPSVMPLLITGVGAGGALATAQYNRVSSGPKYDQRGYETEAEDAHETGERRRQAPLAASCFTHRPYREERRGRRQDGDISRARPGNHNPDYRSDNHRRSQHSFE